MELYNLFLTIILIGAVCAGLGVLMDYLPNEPKYKQPLLYWLRKPFVNNAESINKRIKEIKASIAKRKFESVHEQALKNDIPEILESYELEKLLKPHFWLKPLVLCVYCYPSFWGSLTFIALHGISLSLVPYLFISVIGAIPLTALFYAIYAKL